MRVVFQPYRIEDTPTEVLAALAVLKKKKIVSIAKVGGFLGVARHTTNVGKDSILYREVNKITKESK